MSEAAKRRKKRKYRLTLRFYGILTTLIVIVAGLILCRTVFFNITDVVFENTSPYTKEEILVASKISVGDNLFGINMGARAENLEKNLPYVGEATLERQLPSTIKISIKAPTVWANIDNGEGKFYLVSTEEKVLEIDMDSPKGEAPIIYGYEPKTSKPCDTIDSNSLEKKNLINEIFIALAKNDFTSVISVDVSNINEIKVKYNESQTISYGTSDDIEFKTELARAIVDKRGSSNEMGTINVKSTQYPAFIGDHAGLGNIDSGTENNEETIDEEYEDEEYYNDEEYYDDDYYYDDDDDWYDE